jgi:hypothetical protein
MFFHQKKKLIYKHNYNHPTKMNRKDLIKKINDFLNEDKELRIEFIDHIFRLFDDPFIDGTLFENLEKNNLLEEFINTIFESFNYSILEELYNRMASNNLLFKPDFFKTLFYIDDEPYLKKMKELSFDFLLHNSHFS